MKYSLHIIYALKFGGGEQLLESLVKAGDSVISLTLNSSLENIQCYKLPFRLESKNYYYNLIYYLLSIPLIILLFYYRHLQLIYVFYFFPSIILFKTLLNLITESGSEFFKALNILFF